MKKYDVIIVGAGPAGSTAAKYLAENGRSVLLLDKDTFPRNKPCAGGICTHVNSFPYLFHVLNDKSSIIKSVCKGSIVFIPPGIKTYEYSAPNNLFFNVFRKEFDHALIKIAVNEGVTFTQNQHVTGIKESSEQVEVITKSKQKYSAKYLVCADGTLGLVGSHVRKKLGFEKKWKNSLGLTVVEEISIDSKFIEQTYGKEKKALLFFKWNNLNGYAWVFPKFDTVNIGFGGLITEMKKISVHHSFQNLLNFLIKNGYLPHNTRSKSVTGGLIPGKGPIPKTFTNRIVLCGDAAGFVSPLTGEGIYYAMDSGRIAAKKISAEISNEKNDGCFLKSYHQECMRNWGKNLASMNLFRKILLTQPAIFLKPARVNYQLQQLYAQIFGGEINMVKASASVIPLLIKSSLLYKLDDN